MLQDILIILMENFLFYEMHVIYPQSEIPIQIGLNLHGGHLHVILFFSLLP